VSECQAELLRPGADPVSPTLERVKEDDKLAACLKTFIKRISAVSYTLRNHAHHMEAKP